MVNNVNNDKQSIVYAQLIDYQFNMRKIFPEKQCKQKSPYIFILNIIFFIFQFLFFLFFKQVSYRIYCLFCLFHYIELKINDLWINNTLFTLFTIVYA